MSLITSISGIRGTIGGKPGNSLTPADIVRFTSAYARWLMGRGDNRKVVIGRDGRGSGKMVSELVAATLQAMGMDVVDLGLTTTPTVEIAVIQERAAGGIIITASHNPEEWNALKLLNHYGEFLDAAEAREVIAFAGEPGNLTYVDLYHLGRYTTNENYLQKHVELILQHPLVQAKAIQDKQYRVVVDAINSSGALYVPALLRALGVQEIIMLNDEINGRFAHNPEPLPEHLTGLKAEVKKRNAHLGIAVDPDVDRLCFVCEDGSMFGEEYTLVAVADYMLMHRKGNTVSNYLSTQALREITEKRGGQYFPAPVGEINVVQKMKQVQAVIGGEGNGGVIVPELHYGRDALAGIALFLSHLALSGKSASALRKQYPNYFISKNKIALQDGMDLQVILQGIKEKYKQYPTNTEDGLRIEFENNDWVHLRASNTEPIIRIYAESKFETTANNIARRIMEDIRECINQQPSSATKGSV
ncbi:phosphoglucosamine mutase [Thermoflavifilum thermophilum]|uniref:Phosphomannomutase n=1 Tax=Thermoflavifilum thermophilum TaxID=1393122 RepID=A0A1I7NGZ3_9BACT|nr:phosphoglucosamine mutase [Thermoflavifilum thermophilum]SFV33903.1 phosphomannomutase [Thermoflavifilum thermophilum]